MLSLNVASVRGQVGLQEHRIGDDEVKQGIERFRKKVTRRAVSDPESAERGIREARWDSVKGSRAVWREIVSATSR